MECSSLALFVYLPAVTANLILGFPPVVVALLSVILLAERLMTIQWFGISLSSLELLIYFYPAQLVTREIIGTVTAVVSMLANACSAILGRSMNRTREISPLLITTLSMRIGAIMLMMSGVSTSSLPTLTGGSWLIIVWLALINIAWFFRNTTGG